MMEIILSLPVSASCNFKADIDVEGKTKEEILDEFYQNMERSGGGLCWQCSGRLKTDFEHCDAFEDDNKQYLIEDIATQIEK